MTRGEIMKVYRKHVEAELAHDSDGAASTYLADGYYHHMPTGLMFRGREAVALQYAQYFGLQGTRLFGKRAERALEVVAKFAALSFPFFARRGRLVGGAELLGLPRAAQCLDNDDTTVGNYEPGVRPSFGSPASVAEYGVHAGRELPSTIRSRGERRAGGRRTGERSTGRRGGE